MDALLGADFWIGLLKIVWINIILSGDNAVVIALAARGLPAQQQKKAIMFGSGAAVVLRIALTVVAGPLNYAGVNPKVVDCRLPQPSAMR